MAWERQFLLEGTIVARIALLVLVVAFFVALATAFWKHSWLWGLAVINAGTLLKVIWSVAFGGATGWASLVPSLFTLAVTDAVILLAALAEAAPGAAGGRGAGWGAGRRPGASHSSDGSFGVADLTPSTNESYKGGVDAGERKAQRHAI